jgi:quinoprotein dehydrogenase-associated probable ABC transporter substrate-binding protein
MSSRCLNVTALLVLFAAPMFAASTLKVCADPEQLPFSNQKQQGFENKIAAILGEELGSRVSFEWVRPSRGFVREVVNTGRCDLLIEVPIGMHGVLVTKPYYRSTYVFVTRADSKPVRSFDDPRLRQMKIGVHALDEDYTPPATALARRNLASHIVAFPMDEGPGELIAAVAGRKIDVAVAWGPVAGYYAAHYGNHLRLTPVEPAIDPPMLPFTYEIAAGVRKDEPQLFARVNAALNKRNRDIQKLLEAYHVPLLPVAQGGKAAGEH